MADNSKRTGVAVEAHYQFLLLLLATVSQRAGEPRGDLSVETISDEFALRLTEGLAAGQSRAPAAATAKTDAKTQK
jgi:hypothetical protein